MPIGPLTTSLAETILGAADSDGHQRRLRRLSAHSCLPLFYHYARQHEFPVPDFARDAWKQHRTRQLLYRRELASIVNMLDDIPVVVLKGEPLAEMLFDDRRLRLSVDMDILVAPRQLDDALERLRVQGWKPDDDASFDAWANNQRRLTHAQRNSKLEVHWRIAYPDVPAPDTADLLGNLQTIDVEGTDFPTLDPQQTLVQLCYNFHHDEGTLKALFDVTGWLDRFGDDTSETQLSDILRTLRRHHATGLLYWPLETLRRLGIDLNETATHLHHHTTPDPDTPAAVTLPLLAESTTRAIHCDFIELADPTDLQTFISDNHFLRTLQSCLHRTAANLAFTDWHHHPDRLLRPILLARHRPGRTLANILDLPDRPA